MELVAIVAALALIEYSVFGLQTGQARGRYGVKAPATSGHELFERHYRVQQNTVEQLVVFLPSLYLFAAYVSAPIAAGLGLVFVVGRALYARGYVADPEKRGVGFLTGLAASNVLLLGGLLGALFALL
jgi:glutathione S-transferase